MKTMLMFDLAYGAPNKPEEIEEWVLHFNEELLKVLGLAGSVNVVNYNKQAGTVEFCYSGEEDPLTINSELGKYFNMLEIVKI